MCVNLKGIHKVTRRLSSGGVRIHYYAWRGGPATLPGQAHQSSCSLIMRHTRICGARVPAPFKASQVERGFNYEKTGTPGWLRLIVQRHGDEVVCADFTGLNKCWASTSPDGLFRKEVASILKHLEAR